MSKITKQRFYDRLSKSYEPKSNESDIYSGADRDDKTQDLDRDLRDYINAKRDKNLAFSRKR